MANKLTSVQAPSKPKKPTTPKYPPKPSNQTSDISLSNSQTTDLDSSTSLTKVSLYQTSAAEYYRQHKEILSSLYPSGFKMSHKSKSLPYLWARPFLFEPEYSSLPKESPPIYEDVNLNLAISKLVNSTIVQPSFVLGYLKSAILSQEAGNGCYYTSINHFKGALMVSELMRPEQINWCKYRIGLAYFIYAQRSHCLTFVDFCIDYLSSFLNQDSKLLHLDALLYRAMCYWYKNDLESGNADLDALLLLDPSTSNLISKLKSDFQKNPVFILPSTSL